MSGMQRFHNDDYVSITMEFRCNLKCVHCMIEGTMDQLQPQGMAEFEALLQRQREQQLWQGIILTGSEITLRKDLPQLVEQAKAAGFAHVRIQTHGMHLGQSSYCDRLLEAGVDQFFVSVAGADADSHDSITGVPGSFEKMLRGMEYLDQFEHVALLTNTVVTTRSYRLLPALVENFSHLKQLQQMEFWNFWAMAESDQKGLAARCSDIQPYLLNALQHARELGRGIEVKNFPECLMGEFAEALVNDQPELLIDPSFWDEFARNGFFECVHRAECSSEQCLGLNRAYTAQYGWERELLQPIQDGRLIARSRQ